MWFPLFPPTTPSCQVTYKGNMKLLSVFLILAALHTLDGKVTPKVKKDKAVNLDDGATGRYCGSVSLLLASEYVELWVHAHSKTFDFRARGIATVPWCPGNKFSEEIKDNGDRVGVPIMTYVFPPSCSSIFLMKPHQQNILGYCLRGV